MARGIRILAAILVAAGAAGVLAAMAVVVRHNTARAGTPAGLYAACTPPGCATPRPASRPSPRPTPRATTAPPVEQIATYVKIRPGQVVKDSIVVHVTLRRGVPGPVHYLLVFLDGTSRFTGTAYKSPWSFPDNSKIWNTRKVPDGRYLLSVSVGGGPVEQEVAFTVKNHGNAAG